MTHVQDWVVDSVFMNHPYSNSGEDTMVQYHSMN